MLPEGTGMSVRLITARYPTVVGFVRSVHVRVFFPVRAVGEPPVTSFVLAFERFLACKITGRVITIIFFFSVVAIAIADTSIIRVHVFLTIKNKHLYGDTVYLDVCIQ